MDNIVLWKIALVFVFVSMSACSLSKLDDRSELEKTIDACKVAAKYVSNDTNGTSPLNKNENKNALPKSAEMHYHDSFKNCMAERWNDEWDNIGVDEEALAQ